MYFNSLDFAFFLPLSFIGYWFIFNKNLKFQNFFIVIISYIFYGWWDWRFLFLLFFSSMVDFELAKRIHLSKSNINRKLFLISSLVINIGLLGFFKYSNFFIDSFVEAFTFFGHEFSASHLEIVLPVGISFYTFQTLSYSLDSYYRKLVPTNDPIAFLAFVSFFPQLVAGPIERATNLLPQFLKSRTFDYVVASDGMRQILWGLFKKMVIADNCAVFANEIFSNSENLGGSTLLLGAVFFSFQIYCDFSGYSDIAIGTSRLFGFSLMKNFSFPYFSRDVAEFWRRWHISLSTWFRDYLYIPLGGSSGSVFSKVRNTLIIFIVSGFWHGASWNFIVWGMLNGLLFLPYILTNSNRKNLVIAGSNKWFPDLKDVGSIVLTFLAITLTWIFFRAENMTQALNYVTEIFSESLISIPELQDPRMCIVILLLLAFFVLAEWIGREGEYGIANLHNYFSRQARWIFYASLVFIISMFMTSNETAFIYFQF